MWLLCPGDTSTCEASKSGDSETLWVGACKRGWGGRKRRVFKSREGKKEGRTPKLYGDGVEGRGEVNICKNWVELKGGYGDEDCPGCLKLEIEGCNKLAVIG